LHTVTVSRNPRQPLLSVPFLLALVHNRNPNPNPLGAGGGDSDDSPLYVFDWDYAEEKALSHTRTLNAECPAQPQPGFPKHSRTLCRSP
jgi:hypothetical protein